MEVLVTTETSPSPLVQKVLDATEKIFADKSFSDPKARKKMLGPMPDLQSFLADKAEVLEKWNTEGRDPIMAACYQEALLTKPQEQHLFRQYNLLKSLARSNALKGQVKLAQRYLLRAQELRKFIALCNMRLAINVAKKIATNIEREVLINEAYYSVFKAVEYFDWKRKAPYKGKLRLIKFSTYCTWAVQRSLWGFVRREQDSAFKMGESINEVELDQKESREAGFVEELQNLADKKFAARLLRFANPRSREIIILRYGLTPGSEPQTLKEVGELFGVTKERIRQLEAKGFKEIQAGIERRGIEYAP